MGKSTYVPTGRPPGRPKKPEVERQGIRDVRAVMANPMVDPASVPLDAICPDCFPGGWPEGVRALQCGHGVWVRRMI